MQIPRYWRTQRSRYALVGVECSQCGSKLFPPRRTCVDCGSTELVEYRFSGRGEVYSFSTVRQAPNGFSGQVPYVVALVRLEEGPLVASQLASVDPERVEIGMPLEMVTRRLSEDGPQGIVVYGYKFRPVLVPSSDGAAEPLSDLRSAMLSSHPPTGLATP